MANLLPEGTYFGKVVRQGSYTSKADGKGTPYIGLEYLLTEREGNSGLREKMDQPVTRIHKLWLTGKAIGITEAVLKSLGFVGTDLDQLNPWHAEAQSLKDKPVSVDITHKVTQDENGKEQRQESMWLSRRKETLTKALSDEVLSEARRLFKEAAEIADKKRANKAPAPAEKKAEEFPYGANEKKKKTKKK